MIEKFQLTDSVVAIVLAILLVISPAVLANETVVMANVNQTVLTVNVNETVVMAIGLDTVCAMDCDFYDCHVVLANDHEVLLATNLESCYCFVAICCDFEVASPLVV